MTVVLNLLMTNL